MLIPREVVFDENGIAICAGTACMSHTGRRVIISLPSEHYDFIDYDVRGKTEAQIVEELLPKP